MFWVLVLLVFLNFPLWLVACDSRHGFSDMEYHTGDLHRHGGECPDPSWVFTSFADLGCGGFGWPVCGWHTLWGPASWDGSLPPSCPKYLAMPTCLCPIHLPIPRWNNIHLMTGMSYSGFVADGRVLPHMVKPQPIVVKSPLGTCILSIQSWSP